MENTQQPRGYSTGFPTGTLEKWYQVATTRLPAAVNMIVRTIDPLIYAALIELLGSNTRFEKTSGDVRPLYAEDATISALQCQLKYNVPDFVNPGCEPEAVEHDRKFILSKCTQVTTVRWAANSITIDTDTGEVVATFAVGV